MREVDENIGSVREATEQLADELGPTELAEVAAVVVEVLGDARERTGGLPWIRQEAVVVRTARNGAEGSARGFDTFNVIW